MRFLLIPAVLILTFGVTLVSWGYQETLTGADLVAELTPATPGPGQTVTINLTSYSFDINRATINWVVNGTPVSAGTGKKSLAITLGNPGRSTTVSVIATGPNGQTVSKQLVWNFGDADILWEADTTAPPFYKGKKLAAEGAPVRAVVLPSFGRGINTDTMLFDWKSGGDTVLQGTGRSWAEMTASRNYRPPVTVTVSSPDGDTTITKSIVIPVANPLTVFYDIDPALGPRYETALGGTASLAKGELTIAAEPYFYPAKNIPGLVYTWTSYGKTLPTSTRTPNIITVSRADGISGTSEIGLTLSDALNRFATITKKLTVTLTGDIGATL